LKLKSKILLSILATSSAAFAQTAPAPAAAPAAPETTIAYNVGVVSQYRYRGLAQTHGMPALQGGVDYSNANGAYLGIWASSIRWIKDASTSNSGNVKNVDGKSEIDIYGGYKFDASGVTYDVGVLRYQYAGNTLANIATSSGYSYDLVNANTTEVYGAATAGVYTLKYSKATSNLFGYQNSSGSTYIDLTANFDMGSGFTLSPHVGRQAVKGTSSSYYPGGLSYSDYSLTLAKDMGNGVSATITAVSTNAKNNSNFLSNKTAYNAAKDTVVVGVKYTF
jgi:uncharacterized protein (TIGR02001 family)